MKEYNVVPLMEIEIKDDVLGWYCKKMGKKLIVGYLSKRGIILFGKEIDHGIIAGFTLIDNLERKLLEAIVPYSSEIVIDNGSVLDRFMRKLFSSENVQIIKKGKKYYIIIPSIEMAIVFSGFELKPYVYILDKGNPDKLDKKHYAKVKFNSELMQLRDEFMISTFFEDKQEAIKKLISKVYDLLKSKVPKYHRGSSIEERFLNEITYLSLLNCLKDNCLEKEVKNMIVGRRNIPSTVLNKYLVRINNDFIELYFEKDGRKYSIRLADDKVQGFFISGRKITINDSRILNMVDLYNRIKIEALWVELKGLESMFSGEKNKKSTALLSKVTYLYNILEMFSQLADKSL